MLDKQEIINKLEAEAESLNAAKQLVEESTAKISEILEQIAAEEPDAFYRHEILMCVYWLYPAIPIEIIKQAFILSEEEIIKIVGLRPFNIRFVCKECQTSAVVPRFLKNRAELATTLANLEDYTPEVCNSCALLLAAYEMDKDEQRLSEIDLACSIYKQQVRTSPGKEYDALTFIIDSILEDGEENTLVPQDIVKELNDRHAVSYNEYLLSRYWKIVRNYVVSQRGNACQFCSGKLKLNVHHRTYENVRNEHYNLEDLTVTCENCHSKIHNKKKE